MKAIVCTKYGSPDVLQLQEVAKPIPSDNEVLIKILASSVAPGDCEVRGFKIPLLFWLPIRLFLGLKKPGNGILGQELAGVIEAVGNGVRQFKPGDAIFAPTTLRYGAHAEYICLPATWVIVPKPQNMTFEEAATVPVAGLNTLGILRKGNLQNGDKILINGAGGCFGTFAIQLAKLSGAEVTAVDSTSRLEMMRSLGADHVIDYTREDFTKNGQTYDVIFDMVATSPYARFIKSLKPNGRYLLATPILSKLMRGRWTALTSNKRVAAGLSKFSKEDLNYLKGLIEEGKVKTFIDRQYPLEQVADAHRYVESGQKIGHVVVTLNYVEKPENGV